jgi:hypothetical protein
MKEQLTVRLDPEVLKAARAKAQRDNTSVSAVIAEAATRSLLHAGHAEWEAGIVRALDRIGGKLERLDKRQTFEAGVLKEMVGLFVRAYFNHTPAIPERALRPALLSGKERFARFMDTLAQNLGKGQSVLRQAPAPEGDEPSKPNPVEVQEIPPAGSPPSFQPDVVHGHAETPNSKTPQLTFPVPAPESTHVAEQNTSAPAKRRWGIFPPTT